MPSGYQTIPDYAREQGVTPARIYHLCAVGLPNEVMAGRRVVRVAEADAWREQRRQRVGRPCIAEMAS